MLHLVEDGAGAVAEGLDHYVIAAQTPFQGVGDGLGLLVDLFEHVVAVLALVTGVVGKLGFQLLAHHGIALGIEDVHVATGHLGHIPLFQEDEAAGHRQQGHLIGGDEVLADAATDHQGRAGAGHHHAAVVTAVHHYCAVGTAQLLHRDLHGRQQAGGGFQLVVHQVGDHLGVGV